MTTRTKKTASIISPEVWKNEPYAEEQTISLPNELERSSGSFAVYQAKDRCVPYIDGLKPAQRRILWCLYDRRNRPGTPYSKSIAVAGDVVGRFHPHGDVSAYQSASNMARTKGDDTNCGACSLNLCLIDGHGNFGGAFGDEPASSRYTEMRLSKTGDACVTDVANGAVRMKYAFDAKSVEPILLPARLPLLLINGTFGLGQGFHIQWLPHNPSEAIKACMMRLENPKSTAADLKKIMPGPDFPNGGVVVDDGGILEGYETGRGRIMLTSRYEIISESRGRKVINFTETPYEQPRSGDKGLVQSIIACAKEHPELGITQVKDLQGSEVDCIIEVSLKSCTDAFANNVALYLLSTKSKTGLSQTTGCDQTFVNGRFEEIAEEDATGRKNVISLVHEMPELSGTLGYIDAFLEFRRACITNKCRKQISDAEAKLHLLEGMISCLADIDEVVAIIRRSADKEAAAKGLMKRYKIDRIQADYVGAIPLYRLTRSDKIQLQDNAKNLKNEIKRLNAIIKTKKSLNTKLANELEEDLAAQTLPRRTTICNASGKVIHHGTSSKRGDVIPGIGDATTQAAPEKILESAEPDGTTDITLASDGRCFLGTDAKLPSTVILRDIDQKSEIFVMYRDGDSDRIPAWELPSSSSSSPRKPVAGLFPMPENGNGTAFICTKNGKVKALDLSNLTKTKQCPAMSLASGDEALSCVLLSGGETCVLVTDDAQLLAFDASLVNPQGRTSGGVAGIAIKNKAKVIFGAAINPSSDVITWSKKGAKKTPLSEFPHKGRGTSGVRCHKLLKGEDKLVGAFAAPAPKLMSGTRKTNIKDGNRDGSAQQPVPATSIGTI